MPTGNAFSQRQRDEIRRAIRYARQESDLPVSVYIGNLDDDPRAQAESFHADLEDPAHRVLVAVDPDSRRLEIVTGRELRRRLDDRSCALAAVSMTSAFEAGDVAGGIGHGVRALAEHARAPRTLHTDTH